MYDTQHYCIPPLTAKLVFVSTEHKDQYMWQRESVVSMCVRHGGGKETEREMR
jgi:hypothetical protein